MWLTLDVSALYLNIPHEKGCEGVATYLANDPTDPQNKCIIDSIRFILTHNIFPF